MSPRASKVGTFLFLDIRFFFGYNISIQPLVKDELLPEGYELPQTNKDYLGIRTHSRYALNLEYLFSKNVLTFELPVSGEVSNFPNSKKILRKLDIVHYALNSINSEKKFADNDEEFLPLALSWLWIKGYYAVFHLLSLLIACEKDDEKWILSRDQNRHKNILKEANRIIIQAKPFNLEAINQCYLGSELGSFVTKDHENIKEIVAFNENLYKLCLKKVYKSVCEKELFGLRLRKRSDKLQKINSQYFSIFNLFLYYREVFNYSGFKYLDAIDQVYNQLELKKYYNSSLEVICKTIKSIDDCLLKRTNGLIYDKLNEIGYSMDS